MTPPSKPPRTKPFPSETDLALEAVKRWRLWGTESGLGSEVFKVHGNGAQKRGQPDLIGCLAGRMAVCELKQPGKVPTPLQYKRLREWAAGGALAGWATSLVELDELLAHVDDPGWVNPQLAQDHRAAVAV